MRGWIACGAACLTVLAIMAAGGLEPLERPLVDLRMRLVERPADPGPVLIEIDPRSIHEIGRWPWPRSLHALLIDRLTAAGAGDILFDVDFSLRSDEREDAALEGALARSQGRVTLSGFRQWSESVQAYVDTGPLPRFAAQVRVVSTNMVPAADGLMRQANHSYPWRGQSLPSLAAAIAGTGGKGAFTIDYGIDPDSLTRFSFVDVARGDVDPERLRGRRIVVGATAVELGDMLPVPNHRVLPGVVVQLLAAQSLMLDRALQRLPFWFFVLAVPAFVATMAALSRNGRPSTTLLVLAGGNAAVGAVAFGLQATMPLILDVVPFTLASCCAAASGFLVRFHKVAASLMAETLARRRTEKLMGTVAQNAFDALVTTDAGGHVRFTNRAAAQMFGLSFAEAEGLSIARFLARPDAVGGQDLVAALRRIIALGRPRRLVCRRHNGDLFYADLAVSELADGERTLFILMVRDIDRRVRAERRLLARERELRRAKTEAELANQSKTEFLHNMSHELKTPLNAIIGFSEIMEQQLLGPLGSDNYVAYAKDIRQSGQRLFATVSDVLEFSRSEVGDCALKEAEFDLVGLCREMAAHLQARGSESDREIEAYMPPAEARYLGDERLVKLALNHVLANAMKFTPKGGRIAFSLHLEEDGGARMVVEDTGVGIPAEEIDSCFEAFRQADRGLGRSHEGSGLGLTLAKRFVELHHGRITLQSRRDSQSSGTKVTISLPATRRRGGQARQRA